jgi:hypothetical protein
MTVALMKPTFTPNRDTQKVWADVSSQEITGTGYTAGGIALASKAAPYNSSTDRTDLQAADTSWGPGATFDAAYAVIYDNSGSKPLWSLVDFEGTKSVAAGIFTLDWSSVGLLYITPVP